MTSRDAQKVCIAYPYATQQSSRFAHSMIELFKYDEQHHRRVVDGAWLGNSSGANVTNARNEIVRSFLTNLGGKKPVDWLLFIDTDMVFEPDIVDRLVTAAHPEKRPILGGLCFSLQRGQEVAPTVYVLRDDDKVGRVFDYPRDQLFQTFATGTGCLLIHRSVFERFEASGKFPAAYPWFQETHVGDLPIGEDITFCIRAGALGIPVYVDSRVKIGHEKTFVLDEAMFEVQQRRGGSVPTFAVVPVISADAPVPEIGVPTCVIPNEGDLNLSAKWNHGLEMAEKAAREAGYDRWNVVILNDDLELVPGALAKLASVLRSDNNAWITHVGGARMSGWCFMVRGELGLRADEQFRWWYGDTDLEMQARGHLVAVPDAGVTHLTPMQSTAENPDLLALAKEDEKRFAAKWNLAPDSLWLAQHPDWP